MTSAAHQPLRQSLSLLALVGVFFLSACASAPKQIEAAPGADGKGSPRPTGGAAATAPTEEFDEYAVAEVYDPIEPVNRSLFGFNHYLYKGVIRPVAKGYEFIVPKLVRTGIRNAYLNVKFPVRFVNNALQGDIPGAGKEAEKFAVNTVLGVGGLMTPSDKFPALADLPPADTGQTFAKWGIPHGPYIVLPILGPNSVRDTVGVVGDSALNPLSWLGFVFGGAFWTMAVTTPDTVNSLPDRMDAYESVTSEAVDPYLSTRTGYMQYRKAAAER
jgi:phospholipid-binding lipoprotein MlaA